MRQAGMMAAAGLFALQNYRERLGEDHAQARELARKLAAVPGLVLDKDGPLTNMVYCSLAEDVPLDAEAAAAALKDRDILVGVTGKRRFRLVLHYWIEDRNLAQVAEAFRTVLEGS